MRSALLAAAFSVGVPLAAADDASKLEGAWKVVSAEDRLESGEVDSYPWGPDPIGLVMFDSGHVSIQIMSRDREGYIAYFGTYAVDEAEGSLLIEVQGGWRPSYPGTRQKRFYQLQGDRLTIGPAPRAAEGGKTLVRRVSMERIR